MKKRKLTVFMVHSGMIALLMLASVSLINSTAQAQIYAPEGLNMPGAWNSWTNPPTDNLALASYTQVVGGRVTKILTGTPRWQTTLSVAATGGDIVGGTYEWLFTSGSTGNPWGNKWANVTVSMNTLQAYTFNNGANNQITVVDGKWYTMNWRDNGYAGSNAIFMETSALPVDIANVSVPTTIAIDVPTTISVSVSQSPSPEEIIYVRYTNDGWVTSTALPVAMTGTSGTIDIPGQPDGTTVFYYAFSSTVPSIAANFDMQSIKINNNSGANYTFSINPPPPSITWANLQWPPVGAIQTGQPYNVYGQALIPFVTGLITPAAGLQAWVGYSNTNTDPSTWTNWVPATYLGPAGSNDEFIADMGSAIAAEGVYYYATRFQLDAGVFVYGGHSGIGGGFWDGTTNTSGQLTVTDPIINPDFDFVNLAGPANGNVEPGNEYNVYGQINIDGVTGQITPAPGVQAWIGYSSSNSNPGTWTEWVPATYSSAVLDNDEYIANIGQFLLTEGTYYYASRFQLNTGDYYYGGYSATGGGTWDGVNNVSGTVIVEIAPPPSINWANLQWPDVGQIEIGQNYGVYAQVYIPGVSGQTTQTPGLEAWIGYSDSNSDPSMWTNWVEASFNGAVGNNDEFQANIGPEFSTTGTWYYASRFRLDNGDFVYGGYSAIGGGFWDELNNISGVLTVVPSTTKTLNLTVLLEGLYDGSGIMHQAQGESGPQFGEDIADQITVELRNELDYSLIEQAFPNIYLGIDGLATVIVPIEFAGNYYITIKHRNSIEITSANPVAFGNSVITYNFDQPSSVYGGNLLMMDDGWFTVFGGDANQDGYVDTGDVTPLDNDQFDFLIGYYPTDINGDAFIDTGDITIVDNNQFNFIGSTHP